MPDHRIMLFDLYAGGHHGQYIQQLVSYWGQHDLAGRLDIVVPSHFLERHGDLAPLVDRYGSTGVRIISITDELHCSRDQDFRLVQADLEHGRMLKRYVDQLRPDHCLLMYFDHVQLSLLAGLRFNYPVRFSGIYFRPSFHYASLSSHRVGLRQRIVDVRKRLLLRAAMRNPHFDTLFCLDPFVVPHVRPPRPATRAVPLPDGITSEGSPEPAADIRQRLGVEPGRKLLLLFGSLAQRKGIYEALEAFALLSDESARKVCLALVGSVAAPDRAPVEQLMAKVASRTLVQVVRHDAFVPESQAQGYFQAVDLALVPYQHHVGSSSVLVRAAQAGIPVLGSDYGVMGFLIRSRKLGYAVDSTDVRAIAYALEHFLSGHKDIPFDAAEARRFAAENTADAMAATIFHHLEVLDPAYS